MIKLEDLEVLKDKVIYDTNNDTYVLYEDNEYILNLVDYKLLGFQNGYSYNNASGYLIKGTLYGAPIHEIFLDVDHGVFKEGFTYMYFYTGRDIYKVNEMMEIEWSLNLDDYIQQVIMDNNGSIYILTMHSRAIRKYNKDGKLLYYLDESDNPYHFSRLYCGYISDGGGHLYVTGVDFFEEDSTGKYIAFVDHYDTRTCKRIERLVKNYYGYGSGIEKDDPRYTYSDMYVDGDYIYLYGRSYIEKFNIKMRNIWRFYPYGFDNYGALNDIYDNNFHEVVFDNRRFKNRIYFCSSTDVGQKYCSFGKLDINGSLKWQITDTSESDLNNVEFNICIYNDEIYIISKKGIDTKKSYNLALDDNKVLFETRDDYLVKITQYNYEELFSSDNYNGYIAIADQLKDDVPLTIAIPLLHDYGPVMVDDEFQLILDIKNPDLDNQDSYLYYKLVGSRPATVNSYSLIGTVYGTFMVTPNGTYIQTRYPYEPETMYEYIIDDERHRIDSIPGFDIIRNKRDAVVYFYILLDEYKYGQDIITKKKEHTIITKKHKYSILRKKRQVYRYVMKKLIDIDIIVQHLVENNVLDSMLPMYVDRLRHHTTHMIEDMQNCLSPVLLNLEYCKRYSYKYDGFDYPIRFHNTQIFMCKNIPYIQKRKSRSLFIESMATLVANEEVQPFLIFIDGKVIRWSDMTIVRDWQFSYIIISNVPDNNERLDSILFPCVVRYGEDNNVLSDKPHLYFNTNRVLTENTDEEISVRLEITDVDVNGATIISEGFQLADKNNIDSTHNTIIEVPTRDYDQWSNFNNLFVFSEDGTFFPDSRFYMTSYGKNMYSYEFDKKNVIYKTFYFNKANDSKNMIFDIPNQDQVKEDLKKKVIPSATIPEEDFKIPFDFKMSRDKSYLVNVSEATRYIMGYNMGLLVDYYRDQSNIKSYIFSGEKVLNLASNNKGWLVMPRQRVQGLFDYVIMFKNNKLYDHYNEIKYSASEFYIPIFSHITHNDKVEILHFKNVDNSHSSLTVNTEPDYLGANLRYDNFLLFGNSESGKLAYDEFNNEKFDQYDIEFDYKNNFSEYGKYINTSIKLEDFYYYNRKINIASKRQFHHMYYNVLESDQTEFELESKFRFCHSTNQFMIFVNGIKLNQDEWALEYPTSKVPKDKSTIKLMSGLNIKDKIDIFYVPDPYEEVILNNHTSKFGDIILDMSDLDYSFDNELFLIFVDGHKILKDDIQNISAHRIRIIPQYEQWSNVCICKYLNPDRLLQKVFSYGDIWTKSVDGLSEGDYEQLFIRSGVKK